MIKEDSTPSIMHLKSQYGQRKEEDKDAYTLDMIFKS